MRNILYKKNLDIFLPYEITVYLRYSLIFTRAFFLEKFRIFILYCAYVGHIEILFFKKKTFGSLFGERIFRTFKRK